MTNNDIDVELEEILNQGDDNPGASTENVEEPSSQDEADTTTPSNEDKMSEREIARARELADENKRLREQLAKQIQNQSKDDGYDFLETIEDEPTKNLLKKVIETNNKQVEEKLKPLYNQSKEKDFDNQFIEYTELYPELESYKTALKSKYINSNIGMSDLILKMKYQLDKRKISNNTSIKNKYELNRGNPAKIDTSKLSAREIDKLIDEGKIKIGNKV